MFVTLPYNEALETIVSYIIETEFKFIVDEISSFSDFQGWADFVIHETVYGAATVVQFVNSSDTEMIRDLRQIWDEYSGSNQ